jgi:probable F420-dependent oxidoreductase
MERIALVPFWKDYDRKLYLRAAELADDLGYDSFWIPEAWGYEVFTLLTEIALRTKRIKLGTGIVNVFSRSHALLAMSAASVDEISEGRLILGLGTSGMRVIEGLHARQFQKPLTQLRDAIRVLRTLLAGGKLTEAGTKLTEYRPFELAMTPCRREIPIYVAALKEEAIRSVGEMADGWLPTFWPYQEMARGRQWIAEGAARVGRDPSAVCCAPFTTVLPMGAESARDAAKQIIAFYIGGMGDYYIELLRGFGFAEECETIAALYRNKATRAEAAAAVPDAMMDALAITGDPAECVAELRRRRGFGIDLPIIGLPTGAPWAMQEAYIRAMAPAA